MKIKNKKVRLLGIVLLCLLIIAGCSNKVDEPILSRQPIKENSQLENEPGQSLQGLENKEVVEDQENQANQAENEVSNLEDRQVIDKIAEANTNKEQVKPAKDTKPQVEAPVVKPVTKNDSKDQYKTDPVPQDKPEPQEPQEPQDVTVADTAYTATLTVTSKTLLDNMDKLDPDKVDLVPEDGVIYPAQTVTFYEGESVFDVLQREMKKNKIHMEFVNTPALNSVYVEGINNLYEFDAGELSGWMYKVNDWFPNYGASRYILEDGDRIEWVYTCDLGRDVQAEIVEGSSE